jgi:4-diphosphocytidyl-2-C-methyl-D-erythritol kinase
MALGARHYLLAWPDLAVSTAAVFADPRLVRHTPLLDPANLDFDTDDAALHNDCQPVVLDLFPEVAELAETLARFGPVHMSGTGSALFVPMASADAAKDATTEMKNHYNVRAVTGLDRSPLLERLDAGFRDG